MFDTHCNEERCSHHCHMFDTIGMEKGVHTIVKKKDAQTIVIKKDVHTIDMEKYVSHHRKEYKVVGEGEELLVCWTSDLTQMEHTYL